MDTESQEMFESFQSWGSYWYADWQYAQLPSLLPLPRIVSIHNSHLIQDGNGDPRDVATPERMLEHLTNLYAAQIDANYDGLVILDYEPQGIEGITVGEVDELLALCVANFREVVPDAYVAVWGHPSSGLHGIEIEPEELPKTWGVVDWVCYHDYTNSLLWDEAQRELSAARLAAAATVGKPYAQCIWPWAKRTQEWIPQDALRARVEQAKRLGAFAAIYWDTPNGSKSPDYWQRWCRDAEWMRDLAATPVEPDPPAEPEPKLKLVGRQVTDFYEVVD